METKMDSITKRIERLVQIKNTLCTHTDCRYYMTGAREHSPHCDWMWCHNGKSKVATYGTTDNLNCPAYEPNDKTKKLIEQGKIKPVQTKEAYLKNTDHLREDEVQYMLDEGMTDAQIAKVYHVHVVAFQRYKSEHGLKRPKRKPAFDIRQMERLYYRGYSDTQIAREMGCEARTVRRYRNDLGFKRNHEAIEDV